MIEIQFRHCIITFKGYDKIGNTHELSLAISHKMLDSFLRAVVE